jgi:hypothetical protein
MNKENKKYNGWTNRETWNVAMFINNEENLYKTSRHFKNYRDFIFATGLYNQKTMDGIAWDDPLINHNEMNEMLREQHINNKDY